MRFRWYGLLVIAAGLMTACGSGDNKIGEYAANSACHTLQGKPIDLSYRYNGETYVFDLVNKLAQVNSKHGVCASGPLADQDVTDIIATLTNPQAEYCGTTQNTGSGLTVKDDTGHELDASQPSDQTLKLNQKWADFVLTLEDAAKYAVDNCTSGGSTSF